MPEIESLDHLAEQWRDAPAETPFAAFAEGLRKRGELPQAAAVALQGLAGDPDSVPGLVVLYRIRLDQGETLAAEQALWEALRVDPANPVVLRGLQLFGSSIPEGAEESGELLYTDDEPRLAESEPLLTESLAALYHSQGHLDQASQVYSALLERDPENDALRSRRDRIAAEAEGRKPRPYDAVLSGGRPLREWLAALAAVAPPAPGAGTAYDAFYETSAPSGAAHEVADFEAFQSWLKGLGR